MRHRASRLPVLLPTAVLFLVTGVGVPAHHHADHDGHGVHVTAGSHGHGTTLVVREMRPERPATAAQTPAVTAVVRLAEPSPPAALRALCMAVPARGRSPPTGPRARGPPFAS